MLSLFNNPKPYLPVTDCQVLPRDAKVPVNPSPGGKLEFLIIPKETVLWLYSSPSDMVAPVAAKQDCRKLYLLYPEGNYLLRGDFPIAANVRISDFLVRSFNERAFHLLDNAEYCELTPGQDYSQATASERFSQLIMNLKLVSGVFDVTPTEGSVDFFGI